MTETVSRPPGAYAEGVARIAAGFGQAARGRLGETGAERRARLAQEVFQVPLVGLVPIAAGVGAAMFPDSISPNTGYYWSIRRLSVQGFSAGSVLIYKNGALNPTATGVLGTPEVMIPIPQAGVFTLGRAEGLMNPGDIALAAALGITLTAGYAGVQINGAADCFPAWLLADYLGLG